MNKQLRFYLIFWIFSIIFFITIFLFTLRKIIYYKGEINLIQQEIQSEKNLTSKLKKELENLETNEYIEKIAREELGFIKNDEIIFNKN